MVEHDNIPHLKLVGRTTGFIKVIRRDMSMGVLSKNFSISGSTGLCNLLQLRNEATAGPLEHQAVFADVDPEDAAQKKRKTSHAARADQRHNQEVIEFTAPAVGDSPATKVKAFKAVHPTDNLCVELYADTLQAIFGRLTPEATHQDPRMMRAQSTRWAMGGWPGKSSQVMKMYWMERIMHQRDLSMSRTRARSEHMLL
jgi:hypothetical protein